MFSNEALKTISQSVRSRILHKGFSAVVYRGLQFVNLMETLLHNHIELALWCLNLLVSINVGFLSDRGFISLMIKNRDGRKYE